MMKWLVKSNTYFVTEQVCIQALLMHINFVVLIDKGWHNVRHYDNKPKLVLAWFDRFAWIPLRYPM